MKPPQAPPNLEDLMQRHSTRLAEIFLAVLSWDTDDKYLHWNDLRRRPAPAGFTHEEWWLGLRLSRSRRLRPLALLDTKGRPFLFGQPDSLTELLHSIDRGLGGPLGIPKSLSSDTMRDTYVVNALMEEAITSSQLEGAATTRHIAREMLQSGRSPRDTHERMILNNYLTMQRIRDLRDKPLSPGLVFELHRRVTDGTLEKEDAAGRFRRDEENVRVEHAIDGTVYHVPPVAGELEGRMELMCRFANGEDGGGFIHPVVRAILLHFWLAYDHPFVDGNGRTARALFYWSMLRQGYELFEYISISQFLLRAPVRYAEAFLHTESDSNDTTYFLLHQAGVIREAVRSLGEYLRGRQQELARHAARLRGLNTLNHRQQALLAHALREPDTRYLIAVHQSSHNVSYQTANNDLFELVEKGLLTQVKQGRTYVFIAPPDLPERLSKG
jgi:Fic family protein